MTTGDWTVDWRSLVNAFLIDQHAIQQRIDRREVDDRAAAAQRVDSLRKALTRALEAYQAAYGPGSNTNS